MYLELLEGISLLFMICVLRSFIVRQWQNNEIIGQIVSGLLFGGVCIIGMMTAFEFATGTIIDGRTIVLSMAGLFGGPIVAIIAGLIAAAYRLWLGGTGMWFGSIFILLAVVTGLAVHWGCTKNWFRRGPVLYFVMGLFMHIALSSLVLLLPADIQNTIGILHFAKYYALFSLGSVALGWLLEQGDAHLEIENKIRKNEERSRAIFNQTLQFMGLLDTQGRIVDVNKTALEFVNVTLKDVEGLYAWEGPWFNYSEEDRNKLQDAVKGAAKGEVVQFEACHIDPEGTVIPVDLSIKPLFDDKGDVELLISEGRDISRRKALEQQLLQSKRIEAVGQLSGGVSHHFNNLMAVMLGHAEVLQSKFSDDLESRRHIDALIGAVDRASALTQRMLSFSRRQSLFPEDTDINALLIDQEKSNESLVGPNIRLSILPADDLWPAHVDPAQLSIAFSNIITNAKQAMEAGGEITIRLSNAKLDKNQANEAAGIAPGEYVKISVIDSGSGMSADVLEKAIEPFYTTRDVGTGSGLGLSMVYGFVRQSKGHLIVDSEEGKGTEVTLYVPRFDAMASAVTDKVAS